MNRGATFVEFYANLTLAFTSCGLFSRNGKRQAQEMTNLDRLLDSIRVSRRSPRNFKPSCDLFRVVYTLLINPKHAGKTYRRADKRNSSEKQTQHMDLNLMYICVFQTDLKWDSHGS